jgi:hypothetical protein
VLVFQVVRPRTSSIKPRAPRYESGYTLIRTQSATPAMIVTTEPFPSSEVVASVPVEQIVTTRDSRPSFVELTDDQLLDLARGAPVALVRQGPHEAELVFVNDGDREKLFHD